MRHKLHIQVRDKPENEVERCDGDEWDKVPRRREGR